MRPVSSEYASVKSTLFCMHGNLHMGCLVNRVKTMSVNIIIYLFLVRIKRKYASTAKKEWPRKHGREVILL